MDNFQFPQSAQSAIANNLETPNQTRTVGGFPIDQEQKEVGNSMDSLLRNLAEGVPQQQGQINPGKNPRARLVRDDAPTQPVGNPAPTPMQDPEAISIDLPSRFHYYTFKDLYVKPMRLPQFAKMSKAHETGNLQTQVEAISSLLSTPSGETDIAFKLTMPDYLAVLYWLRLSSFSKPQMRVTSTCDDAMHLKDVAEGKKPESSLTIQTVVTRSDMRTVYLDSAPDPDYYSITVDDIKIPLGPETLSDTIAFLNHDSWTDEEFQFKSRLASVIKLEQATGKPWTWDQRIRFVDEYLTPDNMLKIQEFQSLLDDYGVVETVETRCRGCGSKGVTTISCDPLSFLSPQF